MVMLGMWDQVKRHGTHDIHLVSSRTSARHQVDLVLGDASDPKLHVEVKTPQEFDGPQAMVGRAEATTAIEREWRRALHGADPQLPPDKPSILLLGGLTLRLEGLPVVKHAAEKWLSSRGRTKPNLWGIAVLTYFSHVTLPEGRSLEDGSPIDVQGRSGCIWPWRRIRIMWGYRNSSFSPGDFDDEGPSKSRTALY